MTAVLALAAAFNLICAGTTSSGRILDLDKPQKPFEMVVRVDLEKNRWCAGDCKSTAQIKEVQETQIIFRMTKDDGGDDFFSVNRETGAFFDRTRSFNLDWISLAQGNCETAPFTGFPARKF